MTDLEPAPVAGSEQGRRGELELGIAAAAGLASLLMACSLFQDLTARAYGYTKLLDVDVEASAYTWLSSSIILVTALAILHTAWELRARHGPDWRGWGLLGLVFLVLSSEEIIGIHERLGRRISDAAPPEMIDIRLAWAAPALALCLLGLVAATPFLRGLPPSTRRRMLAAGFVYVGGAAGVEAVQGLMIPSWPLASTPMILLEHLEEGFEVAGMLLMLHAVLAHRRLAGA